VEREQSRGVPSRKEKERKERNGLSVCFKRFLHVSEGDTQNH
jgi:hypothetical protein